MYLLAMVWSQCVLKKTINSRAIWGTVRANINNMSVYLLDLLVTGKNGVGYRAATGNKLQLSLGFSHPVEVDIPAGLTVKVENNTKIEIMGLTSNCLICFKIRAKRPPEPFKGKGVKHADEHIVRKEGKKNKDLSQMLSSRQMFERRRARNRTSLKRMQTVNRDCLSTDHLGIFMLRLLMTLLVHAGISLNSDADFKKSARQVLMLQPLQLLASLLRVGC